MYIIIMRERERDLLLKHCRAFMFLGSASREMNCSPREHLSAGQSE